MRWSAGSHNTTSLRRRNLAKWGRAACCGSVALLVAACASPVPKTISTPIPDQSPALAKVRGNIDQFKGTRVRWGGTIARVENGPKATTVEIVGRDLRNNGRPVEAGDSNGRFLARFDGFLDPAVYEEGRSLTVVGTVQGVASREIGEYSYRYPVVDVASSYLWQPEQQVRYRDPFWYDPWYPYYHPFHRWPYGPYWW